MSEPTATLDVLSFEGVISVREQGMRGMITLRGDLDRADLQNAATAATGVDFPGQRGANCLGENGLCWMSHDELLLLVPYETVAGAVSAIESALSGTHFLAADVSDARTSFSLEGNGGAIRDILAKLTPADLDPSSLPIGEMRRSRLSQVPAAFWFHEDERAELICFRSVSDYVFELVVNGAQSGSEVGYFG